MCNRFHMELLWRPSKTLPGVPGFPETVSRVISGRGYVSPASREQVLAAADDWTTCRTAWPEAKDAAIGSDRVLVGIVNSFYTTVSRGGRGRPMPVASE